MPEEKTYPLGYRIPRPAPSPPVPEEVLDTFSEKYKPDPGGEEILAASLNFAIRGYLKRGERFDEMVKLFSGNKIELVKYLRERWFEANEKWMNNI